MSRFVVNGEDWPRYVGVFERGHGVEALEIVLVYSFSGSGVIPSPMLLVHIDRKPVELVYADSRYLAARAFALSEETLARYLAHHDYVQKEVLQRKRR